MSDQILGRIDGTQDVRHLDLKRRDRSCGREQHTAGWKVLKGVRVLTGRSLDVLCSCLMLWLRVLCEQTHTTRVRSWEHSTTRRRHGNNTATTNTHTDTAT